MKKINNRENSSKLFVLLAVLILAIGYAVVTTTIKVIKPSPKNNTVIKDNKEYFDVHYLSDDTTPHIELGTGTAEVSEDKKTASFNFNNMKKKGDLAIVKYKIINDSTEDANLDIKLTNNNSEYFKVTKKLAKTTLKSKEVTTLTITVELLITPSSGEKTALITGTIIASPIKK